VWFFLCQNSTEVKMLASKMSNVKYRVFKEDCLRWQYNEQDFYIVYLTDI
jgi:hypothetical protein